MKTEPENIPVWLDLAVKCILSVAAAVLFMAAVNSLYWPN